MTQFWASLLSHHCGHQSVAIDAELTPALPLPARLTVAVAT